MLEFKRPDWLKKNLGKVIDRIGNKGIIELHNKIGNKVIFKLIKDDNSFELLPASTSLSELIMENKMNFSEVMDCEILELTSGYICISQVSGGINVDDINSNDYNYKDFLSL